MSKELTPQEQAQEQIKAIYEDKVATINGRDYTFTTMTFSERRSVFAYTSKVKHLLANQNLSFIDDDEFKKIETIIHKRVTLNGDSLAKKNPFNEFMEDYIQFTIIAFGVISYPFTKGGAGK